MANQECAAMVFTALHERFVCSLQLWAIPPKQLCWLFKTCSPSLPLVWHCSRNLFLAFHHWPLFQKYTSQKLWRCAQNSVWKGKITIYPLDTWCWKKGNSSAGINKACWFITSSGRSLSCRPMHLHWATWILHWGSSVSSRTPEISLRTPNLTQGSEHPPFITTEWQKRVRMFTLQEAIQFQASKGKRTSEVFVATFWSALRNQKKPKTKTTSASQHLLKHTVTGKDNSILLGRCSFGSLPYLFLQILTLMKKGSIISSLYRRKQLRHLGKRCCSTNFS